MAQPEIEVGAIKVSRCVSIRFAGPTSPIVILLLTALPAASQDAPPKSAETAWSADSDVVRRRGPSNDFDFSVDAVSGGQAESSSMFQGVNSEEAESVPPKKRGDSWDFTLAPYLWASSIRASVDAGPIFSTTEACFSDLLKDLSFGAQLRFEGLRNDRWGFYLDGTFLRLSSDTTVRVGRFRLRGIDIETEFTQAYLDFGGMYRIGRQGRSFDVLFGGRYTHLGTEVSGGWVIDSKDSKDYVSPVIGGSVTWQLSEKWVVNVKGDVGGFGVGEAADLAWGGTAVLGYHLTESATVAFGYRYYDIDFTNRDLDLDLQFHGPIVGVAFRF